MSLIDAKTGLMYGTSLTWLAGGLGGPGLSDPIIIPETPMISESGTALVTEASVAMVTEE